MERNQKDVPVTRQKMPLEQRAKIFIPFDPLKGFREALEAKEAEVEAQALNDRIKMDSGA